MTKVFYKLAGELICYCAETEDAEFARFYVDGLVVLNGPHGTRSACLALVNN